MEINNINVNVKNGDVTEESVDCIVVPEFTSCASLGGVGRSITRAGMQEGMDAYEKIASENALLPGYAVITDSGKKGVKLAHVATAGVDEDSQLGAVQMAMFTTLVSANKQGLKHIAVPELGTGIIGSLTQEQSAKAVFNAVHEFSKRCPNSSIEGINFVIFRGSTAPAEKVLAEKSYIDFSGEEKGEKKFDSVAFMLEFDKILNGR